MIPLKVLCLIVFVKYVESIYYDTFSGKPVSNATVINMRALNLIPWCIIDIEKCDPHEPRRMDLSCNNLHLPSRGASMTPFARMIPPVFGGDGWMRNAVSGSPLPNVRAVRVAVIPDGRIANRRYTQLVTDFQLLITGDITSVHDTTNYVAVTTTCCTPAGRVDPRCNPIEVYPDDVHLRRSGIRCLNLTTAFTYSRLGCTPDSAPRERINTAAPLLDLSSVYGNTGSRALRFRELAGGRLKAEVLKGKDWPPSGAPFCINNEPPQETRCHDSANSAVNTILGGNIVFIWFFRNHNEIARKLEKLNPCWDDDKLYYTAREINIAMQNQIFYYELMPALAGEEFLLRNGAIYDTLGHVNDYNPKRMPAVSIDYVTSSRWYHSLQEGRLNLYHKDGRLYDQLAVVDFTLRTGALAINNTLEGVTQGAFRQPCGTSEIVVDPDIGERILGRLQRASDVISSDIMKTRDFGMPPYVHYRAACGLPVPKQFKDMLGWMDREQVEALSMSYESVYDIDIHVGILAERPMAGVGLGPTLACITVDQMKRWRQSDRFWYENDHHPGAFTTDQLYEIRKITIAKILCDNGDQVDHIQPAAFLVIGEGNELTSCSNIQGPNLDAWKDQSCSPKHLHKEDIHAPDYDTQGWNQNSYIDSNPQIYQKGHPNRDRLITPWVGVIQPYEHKFTRSEISNSGRPIYGMNNLPYNIPFGDQLHASSNIVKTNDKSAEIKDEKDSTGSSNIIEVVKPLEKNEEIENLSGKLTLETQAEGSERITLKDNSNSNISKDKTVASSLTQGQFDFLQRISKEGQPGFEEFGFFAVLPKESKLVGSESLQNIRIFPAKNITENARNFVANLTRYIESRPRILDYIPRF